MKQTRLLSFGFGLVDTDVYLAKEDPKDVVKTINETKNATDVSFSKSSQPEFLAKEKIIGLQKGKEEVVKKPQNVKKGIR